MAMRMSKEDKEMQRVEENCNKFLRSIGVKPICDKSIDELKSEMDSLSLGTGRAQDLYHMNLRKRYLELKDKQAKKGE